MSATPSLTKCPVSGREMPLVERTTFTGDDMRIYCCDVCQKERTVNSGKALWKVLSDAREEEPITPDDQQDRNVVCSGCGTVVPESRITVMPYYNSEVGRHVTTFRCPSCRASSLAQTRARLKGTSDTAELRSAADVLCRHGIFVHEYVRGDPDEAIRTGILKCIGLIESGALRLRIDETSRA